MADENVESQDSSMESKTVQAWSRLYEECKTDFSNLRSIPRFTKYNEALYENLSEEVGRLSGFRKPVRIWSAGSGYDFVSLKLKLVYGELVDVTIYDVSSQCIESNKQTFARFGLDANCVVGNLFDSDYKEEFDVVTNTGLLEHFSQIEQEELMRRFSRSLRPGGVYLALVPYAGARLYNFFMSRSKRIGTWKYGYENPLSSLKSLENDEMVLVEEFPVGAVDQLNLAKDAFPLAGQIVCPAIEIVKILNRISESILMKAISGYCLFGKFKKMKGDSM